MKKNKYLHQYISYAIMIFILGIILGVYAFPSTFSNSGHMEMHDRLDMHIDNKNAMIGELISKGEYKCCLKTPCVYCLEKTPGHGEEETCFCLEDIANGRHPCGECIGEILEGHGNPLLSEYFATAIAEEVGKHHLETLKQIIEEKYGMPVKDQL